MRLENRRMKDYLAAQGVEAVPFFIWDGSMKGCWRLSDSEQRWSMALATTLMDFDFVGYDGGPLGEFSGNGGTFCCFVRGHNEFLDGVAPPRGATFRMPRLQLVTA
jgi:hypothetical protein